MDIKPYKPKRGGIDDSKVLQMIGVATLAYLAVKAFIFGAWIVL